MGIQTSRFRCSQIWAAKSSERGHIISAMGTAPSRLNLTAVKARAEMHLRMHCVNVYVRDQDRSLKFYVEQLGFRVAFDAKLQSGERWVAVAPPDGSTV